MNGHSLVKMAHMLNMISFNIIDGESRLVKVIRELGLLNTLRNRRMRNLKEGPLHSVSPLASLGRSIESLTMILFSRRVKKG